MKILTKEEQDAHYRATIRGGAYGGGIGLAAGTAAVILAQRRWAGFRQLTLPFRVFLVSASATAVAVIAAEKAGERYERELHPERAYRRDRNEDLQAQIEAQKSLGVRAKDWAAEHRYGIVFGSWIASMGIALGLVSRNRYLTGAQKLVQARVYAQGLTVAVLLASFALEGSDAARGKGRWETVKVLDPNDPLHKHMIEKRIHHERYEGEDQWMDMVASEERRMKERDKITQQQAEERSRAEAHQEPKPKGKGKAKA
jgi:hypothetical protein